ncbi:MAG: ergothioneine biosynthesis protein EgtB [Acidobacteriota bacterium]
MSSTVHPQSISESPADAATRFLKIREATEKLCAPLSPEDAIVQSVEFCSPAKWHLAHTSWFFETFILEREVANYRHFHTEFRVLYNSYYKSVGEQFSRPQRGLISRPSLAEVYRYRDYVNEQMVRFLRERENLAGLLKVIFETGLHHEQQHQELILTDLKHLFSFNPLHPVYRERAEVESTGVAPLRWHAYEEGIHLIGHEGDDFAFDNEEPRHRFFVEAFELASRLVTNGEYLEFMNDGGYSRPEFWLSDGWDTVQRQGWQAPLYWQMEDGGWFAHTLSGFRKLNLAEPVSHVSFYEADAFARWAEARLATEFEWEAVASELPIAGNFVENGFLHPVPATHNSTDAPQQLSGDVWEWTASPYSPYPRFQPRSGSLGEYNGKFMCNQMVLRGGSCATPLSHIRTSYRNFFQPEMRWQFSGIRLARDVK